MMKVVKAKILNETGPTKSNGAYVNEMIGFKTSLGFVGVFQDNGVDCTWFLSFDNIETLQEMELFEETKKDSDEQDEKDTFRYMIQNGLKSVEFK